MMWFFEAWFGSESLVQQLRLRTSEISPPPLSIQTVGFIAFAISASADLPETPATQSFPAWALSTFPSIRNLFWKCRVDEDLIEIVSSALHTFTFTGHWHREQRPSYQVYIALLRAVTAQLRKANRNDERYLEGIVRKALLILRPLEQQLRDPKHGLDALKLIIARALRAAAVEIIEACFAQAVFRLRDDSYRGAGEDVMYLHRSTIWLALGSLTEYLRFIIATTRQEDEEDAVALNNLQNAAVLPLVEPLANFIQQVTAQMVAPRAPEVHRLYLGITRDFMPAYGAFRALIQGAVPVPQRSLFTDIFQWNGIHTDERRDEVEQSLEKQLRRAIAIDTFEE
ncbi:hypothetical protein FRC04_001911 [Tulasnella sp. 424]|nr:hypothetical protein FRC04_001911 [Tulasnella sp. 424]